MSGGGDLNGPRAPVRADVTRLLRRWSDGDAQALERLMSAVYDELGDVARAYLRRERAGHSLETRALIHETYLRLVDQEGLDWQDRAHFYGIAARTMRRILVEHARHRGRKKRGGGRDLVQLEEALHVAEGKPGDLVALDEALAALAETDPELGRHVELRFFGGLGHDEVAELLGVSRSTAQRQWRLARAWLHRALAAG